MSWVWLKTHSKLNFESGHSWNAQLCGFEQCFLWRVFHFSNLSSKHFFFFFFYTLDDSKSNVCAFDWSEKHATKKLFETTKMCVSGMSWLKFSFECVSLHWRRAARPEATNQQTQTGLTTPRLSHRQPQARSKVAASGVASCRQRAWRQTVTDKRAFP